MDCAHWGKTRWGQGALRSSLKGADRLRVSTAARDVRALVVGILMVGALVVELSTGGAGFLQVRAADAATRAITLIECAKMALANDEELRRLKVQRLAFSQFFGAQRDLFFPELSSNIKFARDVNGVPFGFQDPRGRFTNTSLTLGAGLFGRVPTGLTYNFGVDTGFLWTSLNAARLSPQFINTLQVSLTQPLLKNRGIDVTLAERKATKLEMDALEDRIKARENELLFQVAKAYWSLYLVWGLSETYVKGQAQAQEIIDMLSQRGSTVARHGVTLFEAHKALLYLRDFNAPIVAAEEPLLNLVYDRSRAPKTMRPGAIKPRWKPSGKPVFVKDARTVNELLARALSNRAEMKSARRLLQAAGERIVAAESEGQAQLDLTLNGGLKSLAGTQTFGNPDHSLVNGPVPAIIAGDYGYSWEQLFSAKLPFVNASLNFKLPFNKEQRTMAFGAALGKRNTAQVNLMETQNVIAVQVRQAWILLDLYTRLMESGEVAYKKASKMLVQLTEAMHRSEIPVPMWFAAHTTYINARSEMIGTLAWLEITYAIVARATGDMHAHIFKQ